MQTVKLFFFLTLKLPHTRCIIKERELTVDNFNRKNIFLSFIVVSSNCDLFFQVYLEESLRKARSGSLSQRKPHRRADETKSENMSSLRCTVVFRPVAECF